MGEDVLVAGVDLQGEVVDAVGTTVLSIDQQDVGGEDGFNGDARFLPGVGSPRRQIGVSPVRPVR